MRAIGVYREDFDTTYRRAVAEQHPMLLGLSILFGLAVVVT